MQCCRLQYTLFNIYATSAMVLSGLYIKFIVVIGDSNGVEVQVDRNDPLLCHSFHLTECCARKALALKTQSKYPTTTCMKHSQMYAFTVHVHRRVYKKGVILFVSAAKKRESSLFSSIKGF